MILFVVLLFAASAYGQFGTTQRCIHSNAQQLDANAIIDQVLADLDTNKDRKITDLELLIEFIGKFDKDADNHITPTEFKTNWNLLYKDHTDFAEYLFCHFDMNGDGKLSLYDVPQIKAKVDIDLDGIVSELEFDIYMTHLYLDCVPHAHLVGFTDHICAPGN